MTGPDVPAQVYEQLRASHDITPGTTAQPDWWERMAAHHEARAAAFDQLLAWAYETTQPPAVTVAIATAADHERDQAVAARREATRERRETGEQQRPDTTNTTRRPGTP